MADFTTGCSGHETLDPRKRVSYELGMVLGEDEFRQEQWYLRARDHLGVRALHGYGTVAGLSVGINSEGEVQVDPGLAVDPVGRFMCVPRAQCSDLTEWVASHQDELRESFGSVPSPPETTPLWIVLCYRECPTDEVPVPSEDCRPAADSYVASRILDSYELKIVVEPPQLTGEMAGTAMAESIDRLLAAADSMPSGPSGDDEAARAELLSWVTEDRPELADAPCLGNDECCVPLARVDVELEDGTSGLVMAGPPVVDSSERPVLLSTRYLQEWLTELLALLHGTVHEGDVAGGDLDGTYPNPMVDGLRGTPVSGTAPSNGQVLTFQGGEWRPAAVDLSGAVLDGDAAGGDLTGTYPNPTIANLQGKKLTAPTPAGGDVLTFENNAWRPKKPAPGGATGNAGGDLTGTYPNPTIANLQGKTVTAPTPAGGDVLTFVNNAWRPQKPAAGGATGPAGGDLDGGYPDPTVVGIQKVPVSDEQPDKGDTFVFDGEKWVPQPPAEGGGVGVLLPFATIKQIDGNFFQIWFHLEFPTNTVEVRLDELDKDQMTIREENESPTGFLRTVPFEPAAQAFRNVYDVVPRVKEPALLRFIFFLDGIEVVDGDGNEMTLRELADLRNLTFVGQNPDPERPTVTVPVFFGGPMHRDR